jgi:hypothetical protein
MSKFDQVVFIIEEGRVLETSIRNFEGRYIEETTTPRGIGATLHVRGTELWTWGHAGNFPKLVSAYDTEAEAVEALEDSFAYDFWDCPNILAFNNRADAEAYVLENQE